MRRAAILALLTLAACEPGSKNTAQLGYRGVGMEVVTDPDVQRARLAANPVPAPLPPAPPGGPVARWQNVQVLNELSVGEFTRTMTAITNWVAPTTGPEAGCNYCHNPANLASDEKYPKVVARRMLAMTRDLNTNWRSHVGQTGVTCYTCHAGAPVPRAGLWTYTDQNQYLRAYLDKSDVRVQSYAALPTTGNRSSIKQTEYTYALMINMSNSLGVNCTFCHNSRAWATWQGAPATRVTALYGLRMVRHLNTGYVAGLGEVLPDSRLGVRGDAPKVGCATCHNGLHKPLAGAQMARDYPGLWGHPGPWEAMTAADSGKSGITDYRDPTGVPTDGSAPRLPDAIPPSRSMGTPPPVRSSSAHAPLTRTAAAPAQQR
ncbi:photosynthetic reaction center cytochrome PufC [Roseisolibacter sp. H3M3-2]|uniref:photosynthetic reaction center cytochrome PufC n=1 Tax=Roseisolibacter sp. H3M3-2 TaxID=3031323 RepID=UPI0023DB66FF|nr:photosynthetic reaction center cytochrome PufC [Roseisolibacter sp. H3M3-2]MDF1503543.1 photosynthetic reaction center cytochrome PufC [Roseisolibacter sp. H3M3-2]